MTKNIICIECPAGCSLKLDMEGCRLVSVSGNKCPKGIRYAKSEIENPQRLLTSVVLSEGLSIKMVPVRTDKPIPKNRILEAMSEIKKIRITCAVSAGSVVVKDFLGLGVDLIATRQCE